MIVNSSEQVTARHIASRLGIEYRTAWTMRKRIQACLNTDARDAFLLRRLAASWSQQSKLAEAGQVEALSATTRICVAACRVMAERGLTRTRIADIAAEAGVSSATVHYYFRSKDELLLAAFRWASNQSNKVMQQLLEQDLDTLERLRRLIDLCLPAETTQQYEYMLWLEVWVRVKNHPDFLDECMKMSRIWYEGVCAVCYKGVEEGVFTPIAPIDEICTWFVAIAEALSYRAVVGYPDVPRDKARQLLARFTAKQLGIPLEKLDT
jgi:AcrR family transcriptional regulator